MAAAQRKEPLGEGRPQSWRAGTKGTRDKGTGKGRLLSPRRKELPIQSKVSLAHPWQETRHHATRFQRRLRVSRRPPQLDPGSPSGPCCPSRFSPQPLIGHPSPAPLHHPEQRQRIIYSEKRKARKCQPVTARVPAAQERRATLSTLLSLSPLLSLPEGGKVTVPIGEWGRPAPAPGPGQGTAQGHPSPFLLDSGLVSVRERQEPIMIYIYRANLA